jgi:hypothetical protein
LIFNNLATIEFYFIFLSDNSDYYSKIEKGSLVFGQTAVGHKAERRENLLIMNSLKQNN